MPATTCRTEPLLSSMPPMKRRKLDIPVDEKCVNAIRCLGAALPTQAKSGHPGAPIGCAPLAHALFGHCMKFDPKDDKFLGRDRFVLSNGHACALLYTMLNLSTEHLSLQDLKDFRQWNSLTPGHPEANHTKGVEVTTGPLGQGVAQAVGIAMGQHQFAEKYGTDLFDTFTYCIMGEGCLEEGISSEASSLAGHLGLGRLICLFDKNDITIDGPASMSFSENVKMRYESYGWEVIEVADADTSTQALVFAVDKAKKDLTKPTMIICQTTIGYKTKLEGTAKVHGSPLGLEDLKAYRKTMGFQSDDIFDVGTDVIEYYSNIKANNTEYVTQWNAKFAALPADVKDELNARINFCPEKAIAALPKYTAESAASPTRTLSGVMLNAIEPIMPGLCGGSADLAPSNMTALKNAASMTPTDHSGKYINFGVREHAMAAIANGLFAHGGFQPFTATFMMFISYAYPAVRLASLSKFSQLFIATHDSIELGEDGPTHQPVEMAPLIRACPNSVLIRPCDGNETAGCYAAWLRNQTRPTIASLSRGNVPHYNETSIEKTAMGAYPLVDFDASSDKPKMVLAGSGAEVQLVMKAKDLLTSEYNVRVVSFPSWELFAEQTDAYKASVFPADVKAAYVEAASSFGWEKYFSLTGSTFLEGFGASAPKSVLFEQFGFTPEKIAAKAKTMM